MANRLDNYYLINGDSYESSTLYVPYQGTYVKNVKDISDMDLATIELGTDYVEAIQDANPTYKLGNRFYIAKDVDSFRIFKPIEVFTRSDRIDKTLDTFREFSEERNYNFKKGLNLELDKKDKLVSFVYSLYNSLNDQEKELFMNSHLIGTQIKNNFKHNAYMFKRQIDYTQLRNMIITYLYIKAGQSTPTSYQIADMIRFSNNIQGMYPKDPEVIKQALEEYKAAILLDQEKAKQDYLNKLKEDYVQITLFDLTGDESVKVLRNRKN